MAGPAPFSAQRGRYVTALEVGGAVVAPDVAELLVAVDAAYGPTPWWRDVRAGGLEAATANLTKPWYATARTTLGERGRSPLVGFAGLDAVVDGRVELIRVMTHPAHTGRGIARTGVSALLAHADACGLIVWLDVLESATGAIALYHDLGFVTYDYQPGEHSGRPARQMQRAMPPGPTPLGNASQGRV